MILFFASSIHTITSNFGKEIVQCVNDSKSFIVIEPNNCTELTLQRLKSCKVEEIHYKDVSVFDDFSDLDFRLLMQRFRFKWNKELTDYVNERFDKIDRLKMNCRAKTDFSGTQTKQHTNKQL